MKQHRPRGCASSSLRRRSQRGPRDFHPGLLDDWKAKRKEIGMLYCRRSGTAIISAMCRVRRLRNGSLQMSGDGAGASLNLRTATFSYGPTKVWPNWPSGRIAEMLALQACLLEGDWLVLADGYLPKELTPLALPA